MEPLVVAGIAIDIGAFPIMALMVQERILRSIEMWVSFGWLLGITVTLGLFRSSNGVSREFWTVVYLVMVAVALQRIFARVSSRVASNLERSLRDYNLEGHEGGNFDTWRMGEAKPR